LWAGTLNSGDESKPDGALYCLHADGQIVRHFDGVSVSNGIVWTADATIMYYVDSPTRCVDAFDFDNASGRISNRRTAVAIPAEMGFPDGMAIDSADMIWVALWNGWGVARFNPRTGTLLLRIDVPVAQVTACAFGGPNLDDLFITTARRDVEGDALARQPYAGGMFHFQPNVTGVRSQRFAG
jgi:sugar lactone lactonase YvrE